MVVVVVVVVVIVIVIMVVAVIFDTVVWKHMNCHYFLSFFFRRNRSNFEFQSNQRTLL